MTTITAKSILASRHAQRPDLRVDTLLLRYPKIIHAELMTHRMFSRNAASSRAIPIEKLIQSVLDDPFIPLFWGRNQKGMQAGEELDEKIKDSLTGELRTREAHWKAAMFRTLAVAEDFAAAGYHKQIVNRLLEPWAHITVVVSSTNWSNFLALRDHPDAEPHMQLLAKEVRKVLEEAEVQTLEPGEWHLPFILSNDIWKAVPGINNFVPALLQDQIKLSVARCASTSYKTVDGFDMTLERAIEIHDKLVGASPMHASPCEHVCQADEIWPYTEWKYPEQHGNFVGFRQYRKMLPGEFQ